MTYKYYLKQPMPMCEIKLNQISGKNPILFYRLNRYSNYAYTKNYKIKEVVFANKKKRKKIV